MRGLSIIALVLLFASSILTLVHDVEGVNRFAAAKSNTDNSTSNAMLANCDYIEHVLYVYISVSFLMLLPQWNDRAQPTGRSILGGIEPPLDYWPSFRPRAL